MLKREKRNHIEKLLDEMSGERIDVKLEPNESPYFNDYLYGISDVTEKVEEFLKGKEDENWVLFYQVLLLKENLKNTGYFLYSQNRNTYFLMRNDSDFENFKKFYLGERAIVKKPYESKIEEILLKYKGKINIEELVGKFKTLLENYYMNKDYEESKEHLKALFELGEFLKENNSKKKINFKQSDFFKNEFGFKSPSKYSRLMKKHKELMRNE